MKKKQIVDVEKALAEKEQMQKIFVRDYGYPSSVLILLIAYFKEQIEKKREIFILSESNKASIT